MTPDLNSNQEVACGLLDNEDEDSLCFLTEELGKI